jgi:hypothetical protein
VFAMTRRSVPLCLVDFSIKVLGHEAKVHNDLAAVKWSALCRFQGSNGILGRCEMNIG